MLFSLLDADWKQLPQLTVRLTNNWSREVSNDPTLRSSFALIVDHIFP